MLYLRILQKFLIICFCCCKIRQDLTHNILQEKYCLNIVFHVFNTIKHDNNLHLEFKLLIYIIKQNEY